MEIEKYIDIISCDEIEINNINFNGKLINIILKNPTVKDKAKASRIYFQEFKKAKSIGMPDEEMAIRDFIAIGKWDQKFEDQIDGVKKDIHTIKRGLLDLIFKSDILEKARELLRNAEFKLFELLLNRQNLLSGSAETHATIAEQRYIISKVSLTEDYEPIWPKQELFDQCTDIEFINKLCLSFFKESRINTRIIRKIARSNIWRSVWSAAQKTGDIFGKPLINLTDNQKELIYWSCIYDSVYESIDRPSKDIIEDDDLLDSWFIIQGEKVEERSKKKEGENLVHNSSNKKGRKEQFIFTSPKDAKKVYAMNDNNTRNMIKQKQEIIDSKNQIKEQYLPESQNEIREIFMEQRRKKILGK